MAVNSITLTGLLNAILHALGRTPDSHTTTTEIANDAVQYFWDAHAWRFKDTAMSLNTIIAQSYIALPADFEQLISLRAGTSALRTVLPATLDEIMQLRQLDSGVGGYYYYCVSWTTQSGVTTLPVARLEIYPTPAASETGTFSGKYRRQLAKLTSGTDVPDMPSWTHAALKQMCRAWAVYVEDQQRGTDWELAMEMMDKCKKLEGGTQTLLGVPRPVVGGVTDIDELRFTPWNGITA